MAAKKTQAPASAAPADAAPPEPAAPARRRKPLEQSGWVATRTLKVGLGHVHGGEIYPDTPTAAMIGLGWVENGTGKQPIDPLAGVNG